jgi:chromosome segregation ATPase
MSSNDDRTVRLAGVRERLAEFEMWRPFSDSEGRARALGAIWENAPADLALLLALVDEQAAEIAEARRALYRIMQACGIQGEASPERLADLDPAMCGEAAAKSIEDAWRLARERAAEIARLTRVCDESAAHYTAALDRVQAERDALSLDGSRLRAEKAEQAAENERLGEALRAAERRHSADYERWRKEASEKGASRAAEIERLRGALAGAQEAGREAQESLAECNARLDHEARMEAAAESRGAERERARLRALAQERAARLPLEAEDIERVFAPEEGARGEGEAKACHWFTAAAPAYPCESCGCPYTEHALDARSRGVPRG